MNSVAALTLLLAASACGQSARSGVISNTRPTGAAATPAAGAAGGAAAGAAAGGAAAAGPAAANPTNYGPHFFGSGVDNVNAVPLSPLVLNHVNRVLSVVNAPRPGAAGQQAVTLARVDLDGNIEFVNQFGQEITVLDQFGNDAIEFVEEQQELNLKNFRRQQQLMNQLALLGGGAGAAAGGGLAGLGAQGSIAPAAGASARQPAVAAIPEFRIAVQ